MPVNVGLASGAFSAILLFTVVLKLASSPNAAANSFNVSIAAGALSTKEVISCRTNAVEATEVSLSPALAVATVTVFPVKSKDEASLPAVTLASVIFAVVTASSARKPVVTVAAFIERVTNTSSDIPEVGTASKVKVLPL